jgi:hypothetical protein
MGAPGLAFETWDPRNQFKLKRPLSPFFVIPSEAEGSAVLIAAKDDAWKHPSPRVS